ncbi:pirin family protein [Phaeocystidibacter marisrubri]|uniref:Pirin family protein n=1 Tax=Phaeocystidibacter marisrubri TaxID=1577780 RepID=A0A6L3ZIM4_9FLAO|nr:pirin family protein [Phaeocystidibacter marisrubri]KAB2817418.1 pirin family protein [Phaeocystidibacter marisrubri]GGH75451.1 pirin-like protein [Phaeocystidibacter marisrubri]
MSNTGLIIEERARDIGDFLVGRLLPFRKKRMVGPFIFIDHMGPATIGNGNFMDIGQHPHIGISTLTYLFEGEIVHRDSTGAVQRIMPGAVNWMTAGKGAVHTERTPDDLRNQISTTHGFQIWVALPLESENIEPSFHHVGASELPTWTDGPMKFKLIAGEAFGRKSPVPVYSPLFMLKVETTEEKTLDLSGKLSGEIGICVVKGAVRACGDHIEEGNMLVSTSEESCVVTVMPNSLLLLFGGEPFKEERHIWWNFVASEQKTIEAAKERWKNGEFKMVDGENEVIPLPEY